MVADVCIDRASDIRTRNASIWSSRSGLRRWMRFGRRRVGNGVIERVSRWWDDCIYRIGKDYVSKSSGRVCMTVSL